MSLAVDSYESVVKLAQSFYDEHAPIIFDDWHLNVMCDILALLLQKKELPIIQTCVILKEIIVEHQNVLYISIPLLAKYINEPVDIPQSSVKFVDAFDVFDAINKPKACEEIDRQTYASSNLPIQQYRGLHPLQMIRFYRTLRVVLACRRFYMIQKGIQKSNELDNIENSLEVARTTPKRIKLF